MGADGHYDDPEIMGRAARAAQAYSALVKRHHREEARRSRGTILSVRLVGAKKDGLDRRISISKRPRVRAPPRIRRPRRDLFELANDELVMVLITLMVAGNETTRNALSGSMEILIRQPEIRDRLVSHPELIPDAVEEFLRVVSPVHSFARTATSDTILGGQEIKAGQKVLMLYPSGNRDEEAFEAPDEVRIDRKPTHLAFGIGHHFCLGANLARMELRIALRELLRRLPDMAFADAGPVIEAHALVRTCKRMKVLFSAEATQEHPVD